MESSEGRPCLESHHPFLSHLQPLPMEGLPSLLAEAHAHAQEGLTTLLLPHLVVVGGRLQAHWGPCDQVVGSPWQACSHFWSCSASSPSPADVLAPPLPFRARLLSHGCCQDMYYSELAKYLF